MEKHVIFKASGSKGHEVRADGKGGFLARGYYFIDYRGTTLGPFKTKRSACGARDASLTYAPPRNVDLGSYRDQMRDAGRGHLLRDND